MEYLFFGQNQFHHVLVIGPACQIGGATLEEAGDLANTAVEGQVAGE